MVTYKQMRVDDMPMDEPHLTEVRECLIEVRDGALRVGDLGRGFTLSVAVAVFAQLIEWEKEDASDD